jgi:hypothetical protein
VLDERLRWPFGRDRQRGHKAFSSVEYLEIVVEAKAGLHVPSGRPTFACRVTWGPATVEFLEIVVEAKAGLHVSGCRPTFACRATWGPASLGAASKEEVNKQARKEKNMIFIGLWFSDSSHTNHPPNARPVKPSLQTQRFSTFFWPFAVTDRLDQQASQPPASN